jgi:tetratricopeptide (TPR) repeat protein
MSKVSRRKRKSLEGKGLRGPEEKGLQSLLSRRYGPAAALVIIAVTTLLIYSITFSYPFLFDDKRYILDNPWIRDPGNLFDITGTRYMAYLSFVLNYLAGGYNPLGYHLVNTAIHIINGTLVFWLVTLTFKTPVMGRARVNQQIAGLIALSSALIFVSHPVQTQAVTYITQRLASLATLFYLLSIVLFVKWRISHGTFNTGLRTVIYVSSIFSAVLAMKTKEISFTLPFIIVLYEFAFFKGKTRKERIFPLAPFLLTLAIIPSDLFLPELGLGGKTSGVAETIREKQIEELATLSPHDYLVTQSRVIVTYIRLLFLPVNQNVDYDYHLYNSLFNPEVFLSFVFLLFLFCFALFLFVRSRRTNNGYTLLASLGILWFFITLSVESSVIPIRDVIYEHRLYLPGVGAVISFSAFVFYGKERLGVKVSPLVFTCVLLLFTVVPLSIAAYNRNFIWRDEITLWEDVVRKSPEKARGHYNLGTAYDKEGMTDKAMAEYKRAIRLNPGYADAHYNLGLAYHEQGRTDEAIEEYRKTIKFEPDYAKAHNNLGVAYARLGLTEEAVREFGIALRLEPDSLL